VIALRSAGVLARLDPAHGGEILDLVELRTGRQLLGRPPFGSAAPAAGDLDEASWTAGYRGGWQLLAPNAGSACSLDGVRHGFHGRASSDPWTVLAADEREATLVWEGHGIRIERRVACERGGLAVDVEARALADPAFAVAVEHLALGLELLDPEVELELPSAPAYELSESDGPPEPPAKAPCWPDVLLLDGTTERADRWPLARERSRLFAVAGLPEGTATVRNRARGVGVELTWDVDVLPHLWVWHEARVYGGPWRRQAEMLVVEPASVPHPLGLATARDYGQACRLDAGERFRYRLLARPFVEADGA
jgi:hypothetical protein